MLDFLNRRPRCVGLDVGEESIKMAEVRKVGGKYELVNFGIVPIHKGTVEGESIRDSQAVTLATNKLFSSFQGDIPKVATAMSGQDVFIRYLTLPPMPQNELAEAVLYEAEGFLPIPVHEAAIDFIKIGEVKEEGILKDEIMLVATRKTQVDQLIQMITTAGIQLKVIDIEPLALLRTVTQLGGGINSAETMAMVDIGTSSTTVSVFQGNILRFTRTIAFGGMLLTKVLMDNYSLSKEEAESTKKIMSLAADMEGHGLSVLLHQKTELVAAYIENMITEVRRSLEFYHSRYRDEQITRVAISGGGAQMKGLAEFMQDNINLPVEIVNPVQRLQISPELSPRKKEIEEAGTALAVVIGLALSEVK